MKRKEKFLIALSLGSLTTLVHYVLFIILLIAGVNITVYDFIYCAVLFFGTSFMIAFILFPIIDWLINRYYPEKVIYKTKIEDEINKDLLKEEELFETGLKDAQRLAPFLGKEVYSELNSDKNTKQYLIGLEYVEYSYVCMGWMPKIRFTCNNKIDERWANIKSVKPVNNKL